MKTTGIFQLQGIVQHYDWGGHDFIPALLGQSHPSVRPCAELWLGAHGGGVSVVKIPEGALPLTDLISADPAKVLGAAVAQRFRRLPFLLKILDARKMLSIQAHPSLAQAQEGFDAEEKAGIPISSPVRNYKDNNHKPEVHVALSEFWMLHGFRRLEDIGSTFHRIPEIQPLMPDFDDRLRAAGNDPSNRSFLLRSLYERAMSLPQSDIDAMLDPLVSRLEQECPKDKSQPDFWVLRAAKDFPLPDGHRDRGMLSIYLLNLVQVNPGEATYQGPGTLHAYLEGVNVELMANSDNVLRGGLTPKNVDVPELMRVVRFEEMDVEIIHSRELANREMVFETPAEEFELSRIHCTAGDTYRPLTRSGPEILIVLEGRGVVQSNGEKLDLKSGDSFFITDGVDYSIFTREDHLLLFRAYTPELKSL